jgi:hypothetical protein
MSHNNDDAANQPVERVHEKAIGPALLAIPNGRISYASALRHAPSITVSRCSGVISEINADDRCAFQSVANILSTFPEIQWLYGRVAMINAGHVSAVVSDRSFATQGS